jgi:hypothetical protein
MKLRIKGREPHRAERRASALPGLLAAVVLSLALVWLVSSEEQREGYRTLLGVAGQAPAASAPPVPRPATVQRPQPVRSDPRPLSASRHGSGEAAGSPCANQGPANPARTVAGRVYRWTDAEGRVQFSDRPPAQAEAQVLGATAAGGVGSFSVETQYLGPEPPAAFKLALSTNIDGVFRIIHRELGLRSARPLHVNLTIINGRERFAAYRDQRTSGLTTLGGFYSFRGNEAAVRWMGSEATLAVARHEISHLALGNWVGETPLWFNEGLAEVMERLTFRHSYARAEPQEALVIELRRLSARGDLPDFRWFLGADQKDWNRTGHQITYPYAWSLVRFLLEDGQGRGVVRDYLNRLAERRCQPFGHTAFLDGRYPGGLVAFEGEWRRWLLTGQPRAIQF